MSLFAGSGTMFRGVLWPPGSCAACPHAQRVHSCIPTRRFFYRVFSQLFCWSWLGMGVFLFDHPLSLLAGIALLGIALLLAFVSGAAWVW